MLVDITKDAQQSCDRLGIDDSPIRLPRLSARSAPAARRISQQAVELIHAAKRPVILAGHGVLHERRDAGAAGVCRKDANTPVAMTLLGIGGFPASHPLNLGMMGMHGEAWVNHAIQEADLLLAFGMRFDDRVTGNVKTYAPNARKIHIEIDPSEINKNVKVDVALVGDLRETLRQICCRMSSRRSRRMDGAHR